MTDISVIKKNNIKLIFFICVLCVFIYRFFVLVTYSFNYTDEDQTLLWWTTAALSNFDVFEPHFLGQKYGSILESLIAVPCYILNIPLYICLPIATTFLWFFPFIYIAYKFFQQKRYFFSFLILLMSLLMNWEYDVLTSISRSFISGFAIVFVGIVQLNKSKIKNLIISIFLFTIAYINTETTITVISIAFLNFLLNITKNKELLTTKKNIVLLFITLLISYIIVRYCNNYFYDKNPEFYLHGSPSISFSMNTFRVNMINICKLLKTFSFINIFNLPVCFFCILFILFIKNRDYKCIVLLVATIAEILIFLALDKTLDFTDEILFSQARMFLFIPYLFIEILYFSKQVDYFEIKIKKYLYYFLLVFFLVSCFKSYNFTRNKINDERLYTFLGQPIHSVNQIRNYANKILVESSVNETSIVCFISDSRAMGYGTSALNYGRYISYNGVIYDRRTKNYLDLKNRLLNEKVLFVSLVNGEIVLEQKDVSSTTLIQFLKEKFGFQRYPIGHRFYKNF